ncbi:hypothetical protein ONZ45_g19638 [Pleurotus djamor]|nr:hypothetical protein ONZ45_g19638 [Pleurotus djamor]
MLLSFNERTPHDAHDPLSPNSVDSIQTVRKYTLTFPSHIIQHHANLRLGVSRDMPPAGGFESVKYKRNLPVRGPGALAILGGVTAVELHREKVWSRIHLVPLLMAEGDRDAYRRREAAVAREKEIMKDVPGWVAGSSVYTNAKYQSPEIVIL